jgi:hypothetical protein
MMATARNPIIRAWRDKLVSPAAFTIQPRFLVDNFPRKTAVGSEYGHAISASDVIVLFTGAHATPGHAEVFATF